MKKQQLFSVICMGVMSMGMAGGADAALYGRIAATPGGTDYQAYYDDVADLTWLADANNAATSGYAGSPGGQMSWQTANDWAAQLTVDGVGGWRLADTLLPDSSCFGSVTASAGFNCIGSELGNLFLNVLGGSPGASITTTHNNNYSLFSNIQIDYWSATESVFDTNNAWFFLMDIGLQELNIKANGLHGWAVQSGDIGAVPVPAAVWLFGSGLLGLVGVARRKSANI